MTNRLQLVPFNPNDYSVSEVLVGESQDPITDKRLIGSAFSLAFQFPERSHAVVIRENAEPLPITIGFDREERHPSELWIKFIDLESRASFATGDAVTVRFEIFRQCFEFTANVLANAEDSGAASPWHAIVEAPSRILAYKRRRLPRIPMTEEKRKLAPVCMVVGEDGSSETIRIVELGLTALRIEACGMPVDKVKYITISGERVPAVARLQSGATIVFVRAELGSEVRALFKLFRSVAYPNMRERAEFASDDIVRLYDESNYLTKFQSPDEKEKHIGVMKKVWESIGPQSDASADFVIVDKQGRPTGASSATFSFSQNGKQVWALHQLCARTVPDLLVESGQLYTWRAEYLAARPEDLQVIGWFDSKSRWLERIYVKFAMQKYHGDFIYPVSVHRKRVQRSEVSLGEVSTRVVHLGSLTRHITDSESFLAGLQPEYLNASGALDAVVGLDAHVSAESLEAAAQSLLTKSDTAAMAVEFTMLKPNGFTVTDAELVSSVDRLFLFAKDGLADFISAVEHSVAVTVRKKANGEFGEAG